MQTCRLTSFVYAMPASSKRTFELLQSLKKLQLIESSIFSDLGYISMRFSWVTFLWKDLLLQVAFYFVLALPLFIFF